MLDKVPLKDLFQVRSSKRVLKSQWQSSGVPFYRGREITLLSKQGYVDNELFITEESYNEFADKYGVPQPEDIVITAIGTIGNSYIVQQNDRFYFKDASVLWLKKMSEVDSSYINLWLKSSQMREQLDEGNGATVDTLTIKKLQSLVVDLPPLEEQKRIVAILDQVFADIEKARATAEKNLKNARELFDSYLLQVFSKKGGGWTKKRFSEFCELQRGFDLPKRLRAEGRHSLVSSSGIIDKINDTKIRGPGVVTGRSGSIGKVFYIKEDFWPLNTTLYIKNFHGNDEEFVFWFLKYFNLARFTSGAGVPTLNRNNVHSESVNAPICIREQKEIVKNINKLEKEINDLESIYVKRINALDELKKSILQKAFTGELTKSKGIAA